MTVEIFETEWVNKNVRNENKDEEDRIGGKYCGQTLLYDCDPDQEKRISFPNELLHEFNAHFLCVRLI